MKVDLAFIRACRDLSYAPNFRGVDKSRSALVADIQDRAREIANCVRIGVVLEPHQVAFIQALRSRVQYFCIRDLVVSQDWLDAFNSCYEG